MSRKMGINEFVHRANIAKYQKMLTTYLTPYERDFVERRLAEERNSLQQLCVPGPENDFQLAS
jgi:hypothetical protein